MLSFKDFIIEAKRQPRKKSSLKTTMKQTYKQKIAKSNEKNFGIFGKIINHMIGLNKR